MTRIRFHAIAAMCSENRGIGKDNKLPWSIPEDYSYYLRVVKTTKDPSKVNALITGRLSWIANPIEERLMEPCITVIVTSKMTRLDLEKECPPNSDLSKIQLAESIDDAINIINELYSDKVETIYSIGGAEIYKECVKSKHFSRFYLTRVLTRFECNVFLAENILDGLKK